MNPPAAWRRILHHRLAARLADVIAHRFPFFRTQSGIRTRTTILLGDVPPADWATWAYVHACHDTGLFTCIPVTALSRTSRPSLEPPADTDSASSPLRKARSAIELRRQEAGGSYLILDAIADRGSRRRFALRERGFLFLPASCPPWIRTTISGTRSRCPAG